MKEYVSTSGMVNLMADYTVAMHVFSFPSKEAATEYVDALTDAFMDMPESEGLASVAHVSEIGTPTEATT